MFVVSGHATDGYHACGCNTARHRNVHSGPFATTSSEPTPATTIATTTSEPTSPSTTIAASDAVTRPAIAEAATPISTAYAAAAAASPEPAFATAADRRSAMAHCGRSGQEGHQRVGGWKRPDDGCVF